MLSVVVVGRNEEPNLPRLIESIRPLRNSAETLVQTVYVDSASEDRSVKVAREFFDIVVEIEDSPALSASAGRSAGTRHAVHPWILYLDGDMELCPEFIEWLDSLRGEIPVSGWIGRYTYVFDSGEVREHALGKWTTERRVGYIGGAILLPREAVARAGGWNPRLQSNEEIDLLTRLREVGCPVRFVDVPMIRHHTERASTVRALLQNFLPGAGLGAKYYGFGQLLRSRAEEGNLGGLVRGYPLPFLYLAGLLLGVSLVAGGATIPGIVVVALSVALVAWSRGVRFAVVYLGYVPQGVLGWLRYRESSPPRIRAVIRRGDGGSPEAESTPDGGEGDEG